MDVKQRISSAVKNYIFVSFGLNVVILLALLMVGYPYYEQNTDLMMQGLLYNITGEGASSYVLFMNVILAKIIKILLEIFDNVAWYSVVQYIMIFTAFNAISCIYLKRKNDKFRRTILGIFLTFVGFECYLRPSYFKTSAILCVAGLSILNVALLYGTVTRKTIFAVIISIGFNIISSFFSWRAFQYTFVLMTICIIINIIRNAGKLNAILHFILLITIMFVTSYSLHRIDRAIYEKDELQIQSYENKNVIEKIVMFGYPQYDANIGKQTNISEKNYSLVSSGYFLCGEQYAIQMATKIAALRRPLGLGSLIEFVRTVPINVFQNGLFYLTIIMLFLLLHSREVNRPLILSALLILAIVYYYIAYINFAWNSAYTHFIIWVPIATEVMLSQNELRDISYRNMMVWLVVFTIVLYNKFAGLIVTSIEHEDMKEKLYQNIREESTVCSVDLNSFLRKYSIFKRYPDGLLKEKNIVMLDGYYLLYNDFNHYMYHGEWNGETNITWLDCDRDYRWYLLE